MKLLSQWQSQNVSPTAKGGHSEYQIAGLVHDEVFQMFARLDAQAFAHLGSESSLYPEGKLLLWETVGMKGFRIPTTFTDIVEARKCWDILMQRNVYFHKTIACAHAPNGSAGEYVGKELDICITLSRQFEKAIEPLISNSESDNIYSPAVGATFLYLTNKVSSIYLETCSCPGELQYDLFNPRYGEIISKLHPIIERAKKKQRSDTSLFKFGIGIILPLHLTALKCREPRILRQAIAMPLAAPEREGAWDGMMLAKLDQRLMEIEEEDMDGMVSFRKRRVGG